MNRSRYEKPSGSNDEPSAKEYGLNLQSRDEGNEVWRTPSVAEDTLVDILDCEACGEAACCDPDGWWGDRHLREELISAGAPHCGENSLSCRITAAFCLDNQCYYAVNRSFIHSTSIRLVPEIDIESGPKVRFVNTITSKVLSKREFLRIFVPELLGDTVADRHQGLDPARQPSRVRSAERSAIFLGPDADIAPTRERWALAVAAARAFRSAVIKCAGNSTGCVYWKSQGFSENSLDDEFAALCCETAAPLATIGDCSKFERNQDELKSEKVEFTRPHPVRMVDSERNCSVRVPGTHGFSLFKSPSSTLIVPGRTRKHRCLAPVPIPAVWGGLRNVDAMAHLASALQARNARIKGDKLVRDELAEYLVTDEELAFGLRLVALEILRQLSITRDTAEHVFWCTHGHDIPWLHFKVMGTTAVLKKKGKGLLKEQYTAEHFKLLGYDEDGRSND